MTDRQTAEPPKHSPWGSVDYAEEIAPGSGIWFVGTPGHGGFWLSRKASAEMRRRLGGRYEAFMRGLDTPTWFEEDVEYARVVLLFPEYFNSDEVNTARIAMRNWLPDALEALTGETIPVEDSVVRREHAFYEAHKDDLLVISAINDGDEMVRVTTLPGRLVIERKRTGLMYPDHCREFLVPRKEYREFEGPSFVVDPERHEEIWQDEDQRMRLD